MPVDLTPTSTSSPVLLDVVAVAELLSCSPRHVTRQVREGRMPAPLKFGRLTRWPRAALEAWLAAGCPPVSAPTVRSNGT